MNGTKEQANFARRIRYAANLPIFREKVLTILQLPLASKTTTFESNEPTAWISRFAGIYSSLLEQLVSDATGEPTEEYEGAMHRQLDQQWSEAIANDAE